MSDRTPGSRLGIIAFGWLLASGLGLLGLRFMGYWPHSWVAWIVMFTAGPAVAILPCALALNVYDRAFHDPEVVRRVPAHRAFRAVAVLGIAFLGLLGMVWLAAGPLATVLRPLGPLALRHFHGLH
jgi:hypothetical protein